jgi:tryptophan-rich sensory protein
MQTIWKLLASFVLCFLVAYAGSMITLPAISTWYETINKPFFNPPNFVFGPVWTLLYALMAIAFFLVWKSHAGKQQKEKAYIFFYAQLFLNLFWSIAFFGLQQPLLGLIVILVLWGLIKKTIAYFRPISKQAAYLLYPYLLWVSYATILNFAIAVLNF